MTEITLIEIKEKDCASFDIEIKGHSEAERNDRDNDLCCCGCSVLGCTLLANIISKFEKCALDTEEKNGYIKIKLKIKESVLIESAEILIDYFFYGFELIEKNYPENVKIEKQIKIKKF